MDGSDSYDILGATADSYGSSSTILGFDFGSLLSGFFGGGAGGQPQADPNAQAAQLALLQRQGQEALFAATRVQYENEIRRAREEKARAEAVAARTQGTVWSIIVIVVAGVALYFTLRR